MTAEDAAAARRTALAAALVDVVRAGDDLGDALSRALGDAADRLGGAHQLAGEQPDTWQAAAVVRLAAPHADTSEMVW